MDKANRRNFLKGFGAMITSASLPNIQLQPPSFPRLSQTIREEAYWNMVKEQFTIKPGYIMMNAANLCPSPYQVSEAINQQNRLLEEDVSFQHRERFSQLETDALQALAEYLSVDAGEVIISRNTSESNNIIVNGLDLGKGDEVLLWEQNHPTNLQAWQERGKRMGFGVKVISLPEQAVSAQELIAPFEAAITKKTRLLAFSHISNVSGIRLPAAEIISLARNRGIMTLLDGAQSFGCMDMNLREIGCDFYTGSAHKWLMGPKETGILYVRSEMIERLWPNMVAVGYEGKDKGDIRRLSTFGQRHEAALAGLISILDFHQKIGKGAVEARMMELANALRLSISAQVPSVEWVSPADDKLSAGVLICRIPGKDGRAMFGSLYKDYRIACAPTGGLRFSPHIYNTLEEVEKVGEALALISRS